MYQSLNFNVEANLKNYISSSIADHKDYTFHTSVSQDEIEVPYVVIKVVSLPEMEELAGHGVHQGSVQTTIITNAADSGSFALHDYMSGMVGQVMADQDAVRSFTNVSGSGCFIYGAFSGAPMNQILGNQWIYIQDYTLTVQSGFNPSAVIHT